MVTRHHEKNKHLKPGKAVLKCTATNFSQFCMECTPFNSDFHKSRYHHIGTISQFLTPSCLVLVHVWVRLNVQSLVFQSTIQTLLLYSFCFSRHSAPIHWLVHGHMTSSNETVSRQIQMPLEGNIATSFPGSSLYSKWREDPGNVVGNIAKTMMSNRKQSIQLLPAKSLPLLHMIRA